MSAHTLRLEYPALPVLTDSVNTLLAKACAKPGTVDWAVKWTVDWAVFERGPWLAHAEIQVPDPSYFEAALADLAEKAAKKFEEELRAAPLTVGTSGDSKQLEGVASELGVSLPAGAKLYARLSELLKGLAGRGDLLSLLSRGWRVSAKEKVSIGLSGVSGKGYPLPSVFRSTALYEGGRFSGFRDERASGSLSKGVVEARCDGAWWVLSLAALGSSVVSLERREEELLFVLLHFEPVYGQRYTSGDFNFYSQVSQAVENFIKKAGLFIEDEELFRLSLLFRAYSTVSSPLVGSSSAATQPAYALRIRALRATGQRFTESYVSPPLYSTELSQLDAALRVVAPEESGRREVAGACAELGVFLMRMLRSWPEVARALNLVTFAVKLRALMRALAEPGYLPPSEHLYDLLRLVEVRDWYQRFVGLFASHLQSRGLSEEQASEEARNVLRLLRELAEKLA